MGSPHHIPPPFPHPPRPPAKKKHGISSSVVKLGAVVGLSALLVAFCAAQDDDYEEVSADCVQTNSPDAPPGEYLVVDDSYCDDDDVTYRGGYYAYRWYYGGVRNGRYVAKGTTIRPSYAQITSRTGKVIQRGGFGGRSGGGS